MTALTAKMKRFTTHAKMCAQLQIIAQHLLDNFEGSLMDLEGSDHRQIDKGHNDAAKDTVAYLCKQWKAELSSEGICKAFVFVNHQWVVKLGENAVEEAERYNDPANNSFRHLIVPTVPLGSFGCIQKKVTMPVDYAREKKVSFDKLWYRNKLQQRREDFEEFDNDVHMENCGFINNVLYMIDFGGINILTGNSCRSSEGCTCYYCRP